MKNKFLSTVLCGVAVTTLMVSACKDKDSDIPSIETDRWITISGALMQEAAGDGNGGTMIYSLTRPS